MNKVEPIQKTVDKRSWDEFRKTGFFMFMNLILHAVGWAIVVEVDDDTKLVTAAWPARVKFRGFDVADQEEMHTRIAEYLADTAPNFPEEIK